MNLAINYSIVYLTDWFPWMQYISGKQLSHRNLVYKSSSTRLTGPSVMFLNELRHHHFLSIE